MFWWELHEPTAWVCPWQKMDSIEPSTTRQTQLKGGLERLDLGRKKHFDARMAHMLCGCSNTHDVILSTLNDSLCGQNLIGSQENTRDLSANAVLHVSMKSWATINKSSVISKPIVVINSSLPAISQESSDSWANIRSESEQRCFHFTILQQDWYLVGGEANEQLGNSISIIASLIVNPFHSEK